MTRIDPAGLIEAARQATGLHDFDSDSFREGLDILAYDINRSDHVTPVGVERLKGLYTVNLINRLRVADHLRRAPEILQAPVHRPVFIAGMPRTGTTLVSYLLDQDPAFRSLLKWEVTQSAPPAAPGETRTDPRCLGQIEVEAEWFAADQGMARRHYEAVDGPTECTFLQAQDFKSAMLESLTPVPTYRDWLLVCDTTTAYAYEKTVLQLLQSTNPGRWALKMPSHALFIDALFQVFPDAQVIWTHRDPYAAMASVLSLIGYAQPTMNGSTDVAYMAQNYPRQMALHLSRMLAMRRQRPTQVHDLFYDDLMADPLATMRKLYAALGQEMNPSVEARMSAYLEANPKGKFGAHDYGLEEWGLTTTGLRPYFADYLKVYPVAAAA